MTSPRSCLLVLVGSIIVLSLFVYSYFPFIPRQAAELYGDYVLDCELVHGEMTLHPDGTFAQKVTIKATSEVISSKGKWTYHTGKSSSGLMFGDVSFHDGFVTVLEWPNKLKPDYAHPKPGGALLPAQYRFGRLILGGSVDSWPDWKKVK